MPAGCTLALGRFVFPTLISWLEHRPAKIIHCENFNVYGIYYSVFLTFNYGSYHTRCYDTALLHNLITYISACITSFPDAWERDLQYMFVPRIFQPASNAHSAVYALRVLPPRTCGCLISMLNHQQASSMISGPVSACARSQIFEF